MNKIFYVCDMMPLKNIVPGRDYEDIPAGVDIDRLEKIYRGLVERGLPEADIPVAMSYMINESGADPSREDRYGKGLLDGISFKDNMFIDDDDEVLLGKQLDFIVDAIESGDIDTVKDLSDTDYGKAITDRIYGTVNPKDLNSVFNGGIGWKYSEGGALDTSGMLYTRQNDDGLRKYYKGSPYDLPAIEEDDEGNKRIVGMSDVTSSVVNGTDQLLYDDDFMKSHTVYQDSNGRYILLDNKVLPKINDESVGKEILSEELKKIMPDIGYIGGDGYRLRVARLIPGLLDNIQSKADSYGVDSNLILHRLMKEGFLDKITETYNNASDEDKKHFFTDGHLWNQSYSGFGDLGLDDAGQHLLDGRYELKDNSARWFTSGDDIENEKGRLLTNVPVAEDLNSALEMVAAEMSYRQDVLRQRGIPEEYLTAYTNAAYNAGLNHPILRNSDLILGRYSVPDWYGQVKALAYGGNLYDGETMQSSQMQRLPLWDPEGTVLTPMPKQSAEVSQPETIVIQEMPSIKSVPLTEGFVLPQGVSLQMPDNAGLTLLRSLGEVVPQIDNTAVVAPLNEGSTVYTPEMAYNEAIALGKPENKALTQAMNNLPKTDEDIRNLQGMLFDEGYYDTSKYTPEITAKTKTEIEDLQRMLMNNGYDLGKYGVDGKIGSYTRNAWEQYVKDHPDETMRKHYVDGKIGSTTKAAYAKYLTDRVKASLPKIENSPLSLQMYEAISAPTRLAGMATTVIPSHIGAFMNKQANNVYGKLVGIEDYDDYVGDTVENAYLNLEKAKQSGNAERIENARAELAEARRLLRTNKLNRRTMSQAEKEAYMSVLTHINGERQMTYEDYLKNIELIGGNDGDFLGTNSKHQHKKIKGKEVMLYGGNSSYSLSNMFEDENELVDTGKKASTTAGAIVSAEKRIYHDPNRGRTGSSSYYIDKDGNIHISDRLEATEEKAQRGKNDSEAYSTARDYFPRGSTGKIEDIITAQEYKRFIERVNRRKAKQNK